MADQAALQGDTAQTGPKSRAGERRRLNPLRAIFSNPKICGPLFVSPWFVGFLLFTLGPFIASFGLSFLKWSLFGDPKWVGLDHYVKIFTDDKRFVAAVRNTFTYVLVSVPLRQVMALAIAVLLDQKLRGIWLYRSIFYLPTVTSGVATAILWGQLFGFRMGILNAGLAKLGIQPVPWLTSLEWALPTLIFISMWNVGSTFVIYLAGLQGVPTHLYEAAEVDGATPWQRFLKITLPLIRFLSPPLTATPGARLFATTFWVIVLPAAPFSARTPLPRLPSMILRKIPLKQAALRRMPTVLPGSVCTPGICGSGCTAVPMMLPSIRL